MKQSYWLLLSTLVAAPAAHANDFPTSSRVEYVLECMQKHESKYEYLYKCSCVIDQIAAAMRHDDYLDISFDLAPEGPTAAAMPGYGWIFGMGAGTANVGFGLLDTRRGDGGDHRAVLRQWLDTFPADDHLGEEFSVTPLRGAGLPMALHRQPAYARGLLLTGDAAGTVNPFNGEGISYAMETGRMAATAA